MLRDHADFEPHPPQSERGDGRQQQCVLGAGDATVESMAAASYRIVRATGDDRSFMDIAALDRVAWLPEDHSDGEHAWRLCTCLACC